MDEKNKAFQKRLRDTFRIEAEDHIRVMSHGLMELEKNPDAENAAALIESVFREAHSLKGAARSVDLSDIESVCQPLENVFSLLKRRELALSREMFDLFHRTVNIIHQSVCSAGEPPPPAERSVRKILIRQLQEAAQKRLTESPPQEPAPEAETAAGAPDPEKTIPDLPTASLPAADTLISAETVRVPTARLDAILLQAEEMILLKMSADRRAGELQEIAQTLTAWKRAAAARQEKRPAGEPDADDLSPAVSETDLAALSNQVSAICRTADADLHTLKKMVDEHLESTKQVMLMPVASLVEAFPKLVRDLAADQHKDVELTVSGAEIEIDKRILEALKTPFIHLLRNCIDHSLKKPEERRKRNKAPKGSIHLAFAVKDGRRLDMTVSDDGEGVDAHQVREASVKYGLATRDTAEKLSHAELLSFIFTSGLSTSPMITDISGRGLGLAIVREKIEKLGGTVSVTTEPGVGTTFHLSVPLNLATFRGLMVNAGRQLFVLPTLNVEQVKKIAASEIGTIENHQTIRLAGDTLPLVKLSETLELPDDDASDKVSVVVMKSGEVRMAFQVDDILEEQQVLVKTLGKQLARVRNIAGATVLGTGRVVPVLNVHDVMKSARRLRIKGRPVETAQKTTEKKGKILVAEDSITSRTLIKNILETAGFTVATAVDGLDAFTQVRSEDFDLVVSDVDMPQMSGFELTGKIRADKKLGDLPVVLVTALESREDREHGIEVGANAYIVKSSFDQSNLLEVIGRLI